MTTQRWAVDASTRTVARLSLALRNYFYSRLHDTCEAEDLVSRTWLAAGRTFEGRCSLTTYLYSVARRLVFSHWRRQKRQWVRAVRHYLSSDGSECADRIDPDDLGDGVNLANELLDRIDNERLNAHVAKIPKLYREPVELFLLGYGFVEMADVMGVQYNTVRSRFARGKGHLKKLYANDVDSDWAVLDALLESDELESADLESRED